MKVRADKKENKREQAVYLLEYDRRNIRNCAETFENLAQVFDRMNKMDSPCLQKEDRQEYLAACRMQESRELLSDNLKEMAGIMQTIAGSSVQMIQLGGRRKKQIIKLLSGEGLTVGDIFLIRTKEGRLEVSASMCVKKGGSRTAEEVAGFLSVLLDMRLTSSRKNPYFIGGEMETLTFTEEPRYTYLTGAARAVRETETVSGDNFSFVELDNGQVLMLLSDGMGSGEQACADSVRIVELAEQMLEAGLGTDLTMQMMNSMVNSDNREANMSTLDICSLNLHDGSCVFAKAGAASTFIKRGDFVEKISSQALPLGVFPQIDCKKTERQLAEGDMVIMVSDGITERWAAGEGEVFLEEVIRKLNIESPIEMANEILRYCIASCEGHIEDDMTVLAAGIWKDCP